MKKLCAVILCLAFVFSAGAVFGAEGAVEGSAAASPQGMFPDRGYYAASDTFSVGSIIKVTNKANNRNVEAYVVEKSEDSFLLLSSDAVMKLGIRKKDSADVSVVLIKAGSFSAQDTPDRELQAGKVSKKSYSVLPEGVKKLPEKPEKEKSPEAVPAVEEKSAVAGDIIELVLVPEGKTDSLLGENDRGKALGGYEGFFYIQLGSFADAGNAETLAYKIEEKEYPVIVTRTENGAFTTYKVLAGPVSLENKADVMARFAAAGYPDAFAKIYE